MQYASIGTMRARESRRNGVFFWILTLLMLLGVSAGQAADYYVDAAATAGGDGSQSAPFQAIGAAMAVAGSNDTVNVAVGTYTEAVEIPSANLTLLGGWDTGFTAQSSFDARTGVWSAGSTTIDASGLSANAIALDSTDDGVRIEGFRLTGANALGGGLDNNAGDQFTLRHCEIFGNANPESGPNARGAGLSVRVHDGVLVENVLIRNNSTSTAAAQGLYVTDADNPAEPVVFRDVVVRDHGVNNVSAVYVYQDCRALFFEDCVFRNNVADTYGGAVNLSNATEATSQTVSFDNCRFFNNEGNWGGALCVNMWNQATLTDCVFSNNEAYTGGGAIAVYHGSSGVTLERNVFVGNECLANAGGGASVMLQQANDMITNPWMIANNCIFAGNKAFRQAVRCDDAVSNNASFFSTPVEITNCTFDRNYSYNAAAAVGVLSDQFVVRINNNIFSRSRIINRLAWDGSAFRINAGTVDIDFASNMFHDNLAQNGAITRLQDVGINPSFYVAENIPTAYCKDGVNRNFTDPPVFVMDSDLATTGTWDSESEDATKVETTLTDNEANWTPGALAGQFVLANSAIIRSDATAVNTDSRDVALILDNTATALTVVGLRADFLNTGDTTLVGKDYAILDLAPTKRSWQINAGDNTAGTPGATDIAGNARIQDGTIDCGAYEADPSLQPPVDVIFVDGGPLGNDANDGFSWDAPKKTIDAGLTAAGTDFEVWVRAGTYLTRFNDNIPDGGRVYGGFAGDELSALDRDTRDYEASETLVYWDTTGLDQYALYINAGSDIVVDGFTLQSDGKGMNNWGGNAVSVRNPSTDILIRNCKLLEANSADSNGLAFLLGGVTMENCKILGGRRSGVRAVGNNQFIDCLVANNGESGIRADGNTVTTVTATYFINNTAATGAGFWAAGDNATATFDACVFAGNETTNPANGIYEGSAIAVFNNQASITATDCLFLNNRDFRAPLYFRGSGTVAGSELTLSNCNFTGNQANIVVHATGTNLPSVRIDNCIFARNGAIDRADDRVIRVDGSDASINHCLFVDNAADSDFFISAVASNFDNLNAAYYDTVLNENFTALPEFVMDTSAARTGTWDGETDNADDTLTLTDTQADWTPGALAGRLLLPNDEPTSNSGSGDSMRKATVVVSNTANSLTVFGQVDDFLDGTGGSLVGLDYVFVDQRAAEGSPLPDAGWSGFLAADPGVDAGFLGVTRPQGAAYDAGAYEFDPAAISLPVIAAGETFGLEPGTSADFDVATITDSDQADITELAVSISNTQGLVISNISLSTSGTLSANIGAGALTDGTLISGIEIAATDDTGFTTTGTFTVNVTSNTNPILTAVDIATSLTRGMIYPGVHIANTSDGEDAGTSLTVSITDNPTSLSFSQLAVDAAGSVTATVTVAAGAPLGVTAPITLRVADSGSLTDSDSFTATIQAAPDAAVREWMLYE